MDSQVCELRPGKYGATTWFDEDGALYICDGPDNSVRLNQPETDRLIEFLRKHRSAP